MTEVTKNCLGRQLLRDLCGHLERALAETLERRLHPPIRLGADTLCMAIGLILGKRGLELGVRILWDADLG